MNLLLLLTPKSEVASITNEYTLRQVLEKMEYHRYASIPMLDKHGHYVGTVSEGDLLWAIKNEANMSLKEAENIPITRISRKIHYQAVNVGAKIEELIKMAKTQNFVPVTDDNDIFIGIIRRSDILQYLCDKFITK